MSSKSIITNDSSKSINSIKSKRKTKNLNIYSNAIISKTCYIPIINVGSNIKDTLKLSLANEIEGKCIVEGYIKPDSVKVISYSNGIIYGVNIRFDVIIECIACCLVEGTHINCIVKNITKAGIRAEVDETPTPVVIFIARDHNYMSKQFSLIEENQIIKIKVIGQRYELNDKYISIIAELVSEKSKHKSVKSQLSISTQSTDVDISELPSGPLTQPSTQPLTPPLTPPYDPISPPYGTLTPPYDSMQNFISPNKSPTSSNISNTLLSSQKSEDEKSEDQKSEDQKSENLGTFKSTSQFAPPSQFAPISPSPSQFAPISPSQSPSQFAPISPPPSITVDKLPTITKSVKPSKSSKSKKQPKLIIQSSK